MSYIQVLKQLLKDFKKEIWNFKFYLTIIIWIVTVLIWSSEPFFTSKAISYNETYINTKTINEHSIMIFFVLWILFIITNSITRYIFRYSFIAKNTLNYYINQSKKYKQKIIYMSEWAYLSKKSWGFLIDDLNEFL